MDESQTQIQIDKLRKDLDDLIAETYRNNFSASQDFNKASNFTTKLKIPHFSDIPTQGEVGELIEVNGKLYICSSANVFTLVGTQT